jgi:hypothetical protein
MDKKHFEKITSITLSNILLNIDKIMFCLNHNFKII